MGKGENQLLQAVLWPTHAGHDTSVRVCAHTETLNNHNKTLGSNFNKVTVFFVHSFHEYLFSTCRVPGSRSWDVTVKKIRAKAGKRESAHSTEKLASDPVITGSKDVIRNDSLPPLKRHVSLLYFCGACFGPCQDFFTEWLNWPQLPWCCNCQEPSKGKWVFPSKRAF